MFWPHFRRESDGPLTATFFSLFFQWLTKLSENLSAVCARYICCNPSSLSSATQHVCRLQRSLKAKLDAYLAEYKNILICNVDNVGSNQMQKIRIALRGSGVILMGKN